MYKCHLCDLETKQLNGLMSRHWKKHFIAITEETRQEYKIDVLDRNNRPQIICKFCNKPTLIPKGENAYPKYHSKCYLNNMLASQNNPNWKGGKVSFTCKECLNVFQKHSSLVLGKYSFCSLICSNIFYNKGENWNEAKKARSSNKERVFIQTVKQLYPDCVDAYLFKGRIFDGYIPSLNLLLEFDGTYWHSLPNVQIRDLKKNLLVLNSDLKLIRIPEKEWDLAIDKLSYIKGKIS